MRPGSGVSTDDDGHGLQTVESSGMKILVRVKPNAKKDDVTDLGGNRYLVRVTAPPTEGRANAKLIEVLAGYFGKRKREIVIIRGEHAREKVVEVGEEERGGG